MKQELSELATNVLIVIFISKESNSKSRQQKSQNWDMSTFKLLAKLERPDSPLDEKEVDTTCQQDRCRLFALPEKQTPFTNIAAQI